MTDTGRKAPADPVTILVPDAGPLITLAYANRLDLMLQPGWSVQIVDMVLHEVTRAPTPSRDVITAFLAAHPLTVIETETWRYYQKRLRDSIESGMPAPRRAGLGELAIQEAITRLALREPEKSVVLLFEDHRIAKPSFHLPENTLRISTRAFLIFLEKEGWLESAEAIERQVVQAGRAFSRLRFP